MHASYKKQNFVEIFNAKFSNLARHINVNVRIPNSWNLYCF